MSVRKMAEVWENSRSVKGDPLVILLALADWANDEGVCWPKIPTIAMKTRCSDRGVREIIRQLEEDGFLWVERGGGRGKTSRYVVYPRGDAPAHPGQKPGPRNSEYGAGITQNPEPETVFVTPKPCTTNTVYDDLAYKDEPSVLNHQLEPPGEDGGKPPPSLESPLALAIRRVANKTTLVLSPRDAKDLLFVLRGLEEIGATIEQVDEFGVKCKGHWIGKASAPKIMQIYENWGDVLALPEANANGTDQHHPSQQPRGETSTERNGRRWEELSADVGSRLLGGPR